MNKQEFGNACDYYIDQTAFEATNEQRAFLRKFQECIDKILETEEKAQNKKRSSAMKQLRQLQDADQEIVHEMADSVLLDYIGDKGIRRLYDKVPKWYA